MIKGNNQNNKNNKSIILTEIKMKKFTMNRCHMFLQLKIKS